MKELTSSEMVMDMLKVLHKPKTTQRQEMQPVAILATRIQSLKDLTSPILMISLIQVLYP